MAEPPLTLRERNKHFTHQHLIQTAGALFGQKGYAATSIDDIVGAAGASRATLYAYFDSKEALLAAVVDQMYTDALRHWEVFGSLTDWSRGSILNWMRSFAEDTERNAVRNRGAVLASPGLLLDDHARLQDTLVVVRQNEEMWQHFPESEAKIRAAMVVYVVQIGFNGYFFNGSALDLDVFVGYTTDGVRALLGVA